MNKKYINRSKRFAIAIFISTVLIAVYAIYKDLAGVASAIFSTGTTTSTGLYALKIHNLRKERESKKL